MSKAAKNFDILANLSVQRNYFGDSAKLFQAKFLDTSAKFVLSMKLRNRYKDTLFALLK